MKFTIAIAISFCLLITACKKEENPKNIINPGANTETTLYLGHAYRWQLSSTPRRFEESNLVNNLASGYNRAKISWNMIDALFYWESPIWIPSITSDHLSNHWVREVKQEELYPDIDTPDPSPSIPTMNIEYCPSERGPYNYDTEPTTYSAGLDQNGKLNNPSSRWAGIMLNAHKQNGKFIEFWLLDPFIYNESLSGELYINLGTISEDVLKDNHHQNEKTLNYSPTDSTVWGLQESVTAHSLMRV